MSRRECGRGRPKVPGPCRLLLLVLRPASPTLALRVPSREGLSRRSRTGLTPPSLVSADSRGIQSDAFWAVSTQPPHCPSSLLLPLLHDKGHSPRSCQTESLRPSLAPAFPSSHQESLNSCFSSFNSAQLLSIILFLKNVYYF